MLIREIRGSIIFLLPSAGRTKDIGFIRELLKPRLINRGKLLRLIDSEKDEELKQFIVRNWTVVISGISK